MIDISEKLITLPISTRARNALKRAGIETLADASNKTYTELRDISDLGEFGIKELQELMIPYGYSISGFEEHSNIAEYSNFIWSLKKKVLDAVKEIAFRDGLPIRLLRTFVRASVMVKFQVTKLSDIPEKDWEHAVEYSIISASNCLNFVKYVEEEI